MRDEKIYTVDESTFASNPGNVSFKLHVWLQYNMIFTLIYIAFVLIALFLTFYVSSFFKVALVLLIIILIFYVKRKSEHFKYGDSNGGVVIQDNPKLLAVATNLSKGFDDFPVVKIIKYHGKGIVGERVGTVALYSNDNELPHWADFNPIPIEYATNNSLEIQRALNSYDEEQWGQIEERLLRVPKPYVEGLYKYDVGETGWNR